MPAYVSPLMWLNGVQKSIGGLREKSSKNCVESENCSICHFSSRVFPYSLGANKFEAEVTIGGILEQRARPPCVGAQWPQ